MILEISALPTSSALPATAHVLIYDPAEALVANRLRRLTSMPADLAAKHPLIAQGGAVANAAAATAVAPSLTAATDPADTPADADALRDDLVANTIPSLEARDAALATAISDLIADNASLRSQLNALLARLRVTGGNGLLAD